MKRDPYLSYKKPEETGVSSADITNFILEMREFELCVHSWILMKDGAVIAEAYYKPFDENHMNRIFSMSKSFTALAIGLLQDEGKLNIHDPVIRYFPEYDSEDLDPYMKKATIRDLMMMSSPQSYTTYTKKDNNWLDTFFHTRPSHPAGTIFSYDTSASDCLAALADRLAGKPMLEYMKDRMLREMGFSEDSFAVMSPDGHTTGGSGVICRTRDLARVGQLLLDGGRWKGKQLLSEEYVREATSTQICNNFTWRGDEPTMGYGYGYFIWRLWKNSYSFLGMGDQFVMVIPDKNMVFVAASDDQNSGASCGLITELLWKHIVDHAADGPVPTDPAEADLLKKMLSDIALPLPDGEESSPVAKRINGKTFVLDGKNKMGIRSFSFEFTKNQGIWKYSTDRGDKELAFAFDKYLKVPLNEPNYFGKQFYDPVGRPVDALCGAAWAMKDLLVLRLHIVDYHIGNATLQFRFLEDGRVDLYFVSQAEWFFYEYDGMAKGKMIP